LQGRRETASLDSDALRSLAYALKPATRVMSDAHHNIRMTPLPLVHRTVTTF
jgi:hypothetical protein